MSWKELRLRGKSRWWKTMMWVFDHTCSEHTVSITHDHLLDPNTAESSEIRLSLEFRIYRHVYRYGRGVRGFSFQFNVSQVDCIRHLLDERLKYLIVASTQYGLSPEEYFYVVRRKILRLGKEDGETGRMFVKKRKYDEE